METISVLFLTLLLAAGTAMAAEEKTPEEKLQERKQSITDDQLRQFMEKKEQYRDNPEAMKFIEAVEKELGITEKDLERAEADKPTAEGDAAAAQPEQPSIQGNAQVAEQAYRSGDYETARQHYEALAAQGDGYANLILGLMHQQGQGVETDPAKAHAYYERAADNGDERGSELIDTLQTELSEEQLKKAREDYNALLEKQQGKVDSNAETDQTQGE